MMSAVLRGVPSVCRSCLRLVRAPRRLPAPLARPIRAQFLHSSRRFQSEVVTGNAGDTAASTPPEPLQPGAGDATSASPQSEATVAGDATSASSQPEAAATGDATSASPQSEAATAGNAASASPQSEATAETTDATTGAPPDPLQPEIPPGDVILSALSDSIPLPEEPAKIELSDIVLLKECMDSHNLVAAYQHFAALSSQPLKSDKDATSDSSLEHTLVDGALQPVLGEMLEALIADDGRSQSLPKPLEFLGQMENIKALRTSHYTTLLIAMLKNGANTSEIVPVFNSAISFNSENLREMMSETDEFASLDLDMATPHFVAFLVLRDKGVSSDSISLLESVLQRSPYPSFRYVERVLDHHNFSLDSTAHILHLHRHFSAETLLTNRFTLRQLINAELNNSATHENLTKLYQTLRAKSPTLGTHVYMTFITAFLTFTRSDHRASQTAAFGIWNDMIADGITPGVIEWTHLMKSFSNQQDKSAILPLWNRMLKAGIIPDHHSWTVRIHAQLEANMIQEGLDSLRTMHESGVPPTRETINAAIDGLLRHNHHTEATKVLAAAKRLGIPKDITTYNTLLVSLMKQQQANSAKFDEALTLIRRMSIEGIVPDIKTVTLILDGMYKFSNPKPTYAAVLSMLEYCESAGITVNIWTYTALIRALLMEGREDAAMDILAIMESRGMTGTNATYTVLLKYYFKKRDLASIDQLLVEMSQRRVTMDGRIWREIAVGFAALGEVQRMKQAIAQMFKGTASMGLLGFMSCLKALETRGLLADARDVVANMVARGLVGKKREVRLMGSEKEFWELVGRLGQGVVLRELVQSRKIED